MRLVIAVLSLLSLASTVLAAPTTGPDLGRALASGEIDAQSFDFGGLRYGASGPMGFLGAQAGAELAAAQAHNKANWQLVLNAHICPTPSERMTMAGFDSALIAADAGAWASEKAAAEAAYARLCECTRHRAGRPAGALSRV